MNSLALQVRTINRFPCALTFGKHWAEKGLQVNSMEPVGQEQTVSCFLAQGRVGTF